MRETVHIERYIERDGHRMSVHGKHGAQGGPALGGVQALFRCSAESRVYGQTQRLRHGKIAVRIGDAAAHEGIKSIKLEGGFKLDFAVPFAGKSVFIKRAYGELRSLGREVDAGGWQPAYRVETEFETAGQEAGKAGTEIDTGNSETVFAVGAGEAAGSIDDVQAQSCDVARHIRYVEAGQRCGIGLVGLAASRHKRAAEIKGGAVERDGPHDRFQAQE